MNERPWIESASARCLNIVSLGRWLLGQTKEGRELPDTFCPFIEHYIMSTPFDFGYAAVTADKSNRYLAIVGKGVQVVGYGFGPKSWLVWLRQDLPGRFDSWQMLDAILGTIRTIEYWHEPEVARYLKNDWWRSDGLELLPSDADKMDNLVMRAKIKYPPPPLPTTEVTWSRVPYTRKKWLEKKEK